MLPPRMLPIARPHPLHPRHLSVSPCQLKLRLQEPHLIAADCQDQDEEKEKALRDGHPEIDLGAIELLL